MFLGSQQQRLSIIKLMLEEYLSANSMFWCIKDNKFRQMVAN